MSASFPVRIVDVFILQVDFRELSTVAKRIELGYYAGHLNEHGFEMFSSPLIPISIGHLKMGKHLFSPDTYFHSIIVKQEGGDGRNHEGKSVETFGLNFACS
jgi:hypothetical protein